MMRNTLSCLLHCSMVRLELLLLLFGCCHCTSKTASSFQHPTAFNCYTSSTVANARICTAFTPASSLSSQQKKMKHVKRAKRSRLYSSGFEVALPSLAILGKVIGNAQVILWNQPTYVLAAVVSIANFGIVLEQRTAVGKQLSATLSTMFLSMLCANVGIIPYSSPIYSMVNKNLVPLAVSLLLFDSDLRRVIRDTGSLIIAFFVGAFSTVVGTLVSFPLIPMKAIGSNEGWKVASALTARHIGGGINFIAVAETLGISSSNVSAALAADNVIVALYFAYLFAMSKEGDEEDGDNNNAAEALVTEEDLFFSEATSIGNSKSTITMSSLGTSLSIATFLVFVSTLATTWFLPGGTSTLPVVSLLTVAAATAFPTFFAPLTYTGTAMGVIFVQMFFAASGAAGSIVAVLSKAPSMLLFSATQILVHYITLMGLGKFALGLKDRELYIASNANIGGPTTAASMASAKKWPHLIMPGLLVGIFGYAIATPLSLALGKYVLLMFLTK